MSFANDEHGLRVETRLLDDRVVLELHGELDLMGAPLLAEAFEEAEAERRGLVVLDLEDVDFIDSAGLRVILAAHQRCEPPRSRLALTPGRPQVQRLLSVAGVSGHLVSIAGPDAELSDD